MVGFAITKELYHQVLGSVYRQKIWLKIGQMCLDKGIYDNKRIVSTEWIEKITTPYLTTDEKFGFMKYGFLWWIIDEERKYILPLVTVEM